jgi:hypothetical protein
VSRNAGLLWTLLHWWRQLSHQDGCYQSNGGFLTGNDSDVTVGKILCKQCVTFQGVLTQATIGPGRNPEAVQDSAYKTFIKMLQRTNHAVTNILHGPEVFIAMNA